MKLIKKQRFFKTSEQVVPLAEVLALVAGERGDGELALVRQLDGDVLGAVVLHVQQQLVLVALSHLRQKTDMTSV